MSSDAHPQPAHEPVPANPGGDCGLAAKMAAMRQDFLDFFDAEFPLVVRFLMRTGASLADAEDAAQHMALQGWRKVTHGQWDQVTHLRAWARTVALNYHRGQHRDSFEVPLDADVDPPAPGPGHAELTGQARDLVTLLRRLAPDCRAVIAFDLDGIAAAEIAIALGISSQQVRDLRKKARKKLKEQLPTLTHRERGNNQ